MMNIDLSSSNDAIVTVITTKPQRIFVFMITQTSIDNYSTVLMSSWKIRWWSNFKIEGQTGAFSNRHFSWSNQEHNFKLGFDH